MKIGMDRMGKLIGYLLSLAKIEGGGRAETLKTPFYMSAAIMREVSSMENAARGKRITVSFSIQPGIIMNSNEELINQVFDILFDSVVKHTAENGK